MSDRPMTNREKRQKQRLDDERATCRHYTGTINPTCAAGVNYRAHVGGPDFGWALRMPCHKSGSLVDRARAEDIAPVPCGQWAPHTEEEIAEREAGRQRAIARLLSAGPIIAQVKREHRGKSWRGTVECPVCKGTLHVSHAAINGHVWGKCSTDGCLAWME